MGGDTLRPPLAARHAPDIRWPTEPKEPSGDQQYPEELVVRAFPVRRKQERKRAANTHGHGRIEGVPSHATGTSPVLKLWRSESEAGPPGIVEEQDAYRVLVETFRLD
jgi:hypothetical protein